MKISNCLITKSNQFEPELKTVCRINELNNFDTSWPIDGAEKSTIAMLAL